MGLLVRTLSALALIGCAACAGTVTTAEGRAVRIASGEFRDYVERVFRQQNRLATELAFALEDHQGADEALLALEEALLAACAGLNELAAARRDGRRVGALRAARLARQAPECEAASERVRSALRQGGL